jgi:hypothetical protein
VTTFCPPERARWAPFADRYRIELDLFPPEEHLSQERVVPIHRRNLQVPNVADSIQSATHQVDRTDAERAADHAAIAGSIGELLPALIAKLGATGLAELEISALQVASARRRGSATDASGRSGQGERSLARSTAAGAAPATVGSRRSGPAATVAGTDGRRRARGSLPATVATTPGPISPEPWRPRRPSASTTRAEAGGHPSAPAIVSAASTCWGSPGGCPRTAWSARAWWNRRRGQYGQELVVIDSRPRPPTGTAAAMRHRRPPPTALDR